MDWGNQKVWCNEERKLSSVSVNTDTTDLWVEKNKQLGMDSNK